MLSDIEIAQRAEPRRIVEVAWEKLGIGEEHLDPYGHYKAKLGLDLRRIVWKRVMDMNDRALRDIVVGLGATTNGFPREDAFDIVVASEVMAILCLATSLEDLKERLGNIVVGYTRDERPVVARDLGAHGAMAVLVATIRALKFHGGAELGELEKEDLGALEGGLANLERHINNVRNHFGLPCVVAINRFPSDTEAEISLLQDGVAHQGARVVLTNHWAEGGVGAEALAHAVVETVQSVPARFRFVYDEEDSLWDKISAVATKIYGASEVVADTKVRRQIRKFQEDGYGRYPVCIAKTQYSFSTDPSLRGAPSGHVLSIREVRLSAGAEFVVAVCGDIMTMPGLPKSPASERIDLGKKGEVIGLF